MGEVGIIIAASIVLQKPEFSASRVDRLCPECNVTLSPQEDSLNIDLYLHACARPVSEN